MIHGNLVRARRKAADSRNIGATIGKTVALLVTGFAALMLLAYLGG